MSLSPSPAYLCHNLWKCKNYEVVCMCWIQCPRGRGRKYCKSYCFTATENFPWEYFNPGVSHFIHEFRCNPVVLNPTKVWIFKRHNTGGCNWWLLAETCRLSELLWIWAFLMSSKNSAVKNWRRKSWYNLFTLPLLYLLFLHYEVIPVNQ